MLGVFLNNRRIGSPLEFPHQTLKWCAYSINEGKRASFKTRREANKWLREQAERVPETETA